VTKWVEQPTSVNMVGNFSLGRQITTEDSRERNLTIAAKLEQDQLFSMTVNAGLGTMDTNNDSFHIDVSELKQKGKTAF
jgi:hypothetical protein